MQTLETLPKDVAEEIERFTFPTKAKLIYEFADDIDDRCPEFPELISASTTQYLKAMTMIDQLRLIKYFATSMLEQLTDD